MFVKHSISKLLILVIIIKKKDFIDFFKSIILLKFLKKSDFNLSILIKNYHESIKKKNLNQTEIDEVSKLGQNGLSVSLFANYFLSLGR